MTKYAFVIDQRKCIGCHACTVACKAEHDVPIGVYRTWVKYIEKGEFPNSRRYFLVNRCNHCDDAPCVAICPTKALYKRKDGIVDFDSSRCIGCKSCMQACPYDALYIDPYSHTAANVYYLGAEEAAINPEIAIEELPHMTMWSTLLKPDQDGQSAIDKNMSLRALKTINPLKPYSPPELQRRTPGEAHLVYDTPKNNAPWGWKVSAYLGTKSIGTGTIIVAALALALYGLSGTLNSSMHALLATGAPVTGGFFTALTLLLLIADLKRPDRALFLVTRPNLGSWLVWGGYILAIFGLLEAAWFIGGLLDSTGILRWLLLPAALFGIAGAGYTAFLFGQAEGRDFWQSPLLLPILLVQATLAGSAALGLLSWALNAGSTLGRLFTIVLLSAITLHVLLILVEVFGPHSNRHVALAARYMSSGGLKDAFWGPFFAIGSIIPIVMLSVALLVPAAQPALLGFAGILALAGLFYYEHCFVVAGQVVPLS